MNPDTDTVAPRDPDTIRLCNCAVCSRKLLGESERDWLHSLPDDARLMQPPLVAERIHGRPFCRRCLRSRMPKA